MIAGLVVMVGGVMACVVEAEFCVTDSGGFDGAARLR
jgi:hypothetical protein